MDRHWEDISHTLYTPDSASTSGKAQPAATVHLVRTLWRMVALVALGYVGALLTIAVVLLLAVVLFG